MMVALEALNKPSSQLLKCHSRTMFSSMARLTAMAFNQGTVEYVERPPALQVQLVSVVFHPLTILLRQGLRIIR